jgi:hypothetical protein
MECISPADERAIVTDARASQPKIRQHRTWTLWSGANIATALYALVDHGGSIECESVPKHTVFRVRAALAIPSLRPRPNFFRHLAF